MGMRREMGCGERWMDFGRPVKHLERIEMSLELRWEVWAGDKIGSIWQIEGILNPRGGWEEDSIRYNGKGDQVQVLSDDSIWKSGRGCRGPRNVQRIGQRVRMKTRNASFKRKRVISRTMKNCPLEKWFSAGEGLNPQGCSQCLETFLVVISWRVLMHRTAPTTKGSLALTDRSGKPCPGGTGHWRWKELWIQLSRSEPPLVFWSLKVTYWMWKKGSPEGSTLYTLCQVLLPSRVPTYVTDRIRPH